MPQEQVLAACFAEQPDYRESEKRIEYLDSRTL